MVQGGHQGVPRAFMAKKHGQFDGHEGREKTKSRNLVLEQTLDYMNPLGVETHVKHQFFNHGS